MECYNCGYKLAAEAERCPRCGQRFKPRAQAEGKAEAKAEAEEMEGKPSLVSRLKGLLGKKTPGES